MSQLNSLLESAGAGWKNMQSDAARLANKWEKTGLLEGFNKEVDKNNMSLILENQAKQLVVEQSSTGGSANFTVGTGEQWAGIALPLVRKVFGQIAAKEFVSVQPMNLPSGLVFYLDFQYGDNKKPFTNGESLYGTKNSGRFPFETDAAGNLGQTFDDGGLYGAGKFTYSTNQFSSSLVAGTVADVTTSASVNFDSRLNLTTLSTLTIATSSIPNFDKDAVRGFVPVTSSVVAGAAIELDDVYPAFTKLDGGNIVFVIKKDAKKVTNTGGYQVFYQKATSMSPYFAGDFEAGNGPDLAEGSFPNSLNAAEIAIPEINIQMRSEAIVAKTKKLRAVWTPEFAQDLNAYQALDAEAEVTNIMSEYISLEIDLEILDMLIEDAAAGTEYWSAQNNRVIDGTTTSVDASGFYNTQGGWFQTLGTKLQKLSNKIHQLTLRGGANFMVISPAVATILESIPGFASTSDGDVSKNYAFGVQKAGSLNNRYDVYKNPYMNENIILMGYRGSQFLESGAVFAPYIPLIMTPLIYDPETFTPRKGLLTRYAKKMIRPEFYGKVYVSGLNTL